MYFANMKRDNKIGPRVLGGLPIPPRVDYKTMSALDPREVAIVDTRSWDEFRAGHIPGSLSFPLTKSFNTDAGSMIKDTEEMYLVIEEEHLEEAVRDLIRIGLDQFKGWCEPNDLKEAPGGSLSTIEEIDVDEAIGLVESRQVSVLDVRRATEFAEGHLPGATNVAHTRLMGRLDEVPDSSKLLVNCRSGARSARSVAFLKRAGREVINLKGGMLAWEATSAATVES